MLAQVYLFTPYMSPPDCLMSLIQIQKTIWFILHFFNIQIKKKKKKNRPTNPPNFQAKRANKPLFFLRPYINNICLPNWYISYDPHGWFYHMKPLATVPYQEWFLHSHVVYQLFHLMSYGRIVPAQGGPLGLYQMITSSSVLKDLWCQLQCHVGLLLFWLFVAVDL